MIKNLGSICAVFFHWRANPLTFGLDVNDVRTVYAHKKTIELNPLLQWIYRKRYEAFLPALRATENLGLSRVELGSGPSHMEQFVSGIIKTDVIEHSNVERVVDGESLPFADASLGAIFMTNVLHHLREPTNFLKEAERTLAKGGRLVCVEPSNSWLQKLATNRGSPYEYNDDTVTDWHNDITGRLSHANNALPWIIFVRDRQRFVEKFPHLKILRIRYHIFLAFYLSGGFNYRPFVPNLLTPLVVFIEFLSQPICRWLGFEMIVELERV